MLENLCSLTKESSIPLPASCARETKWRRSARHLKATWALENLLAKSCAKESNSRRMIADNVHHPRPNLKFHPRVCAACVWACVCGLGAGRQERGCGCRAPVWPLTSVSLAADFCPGSRPLSTAARWSRCTRRPPWECRPSPWAQ